MAENLLNLKNFFAALMPATGYALLMIIGAVVVQIRVTYLVRASKGIRINDSSAIILRPAAWAYVTPLLCFSLGAFSIFEATNAIKASKIIYALIALFMVCGGGFYIYSLATSRATISSGKLIYNEASERREIDSATITSVSIHWFSFHVKLKSGQGIQIPANFQSSEVILAFLNQAAVRNACLSRQ